MKITVTILPDNFSRELWAANRRQVVKDQVKGWKIDGINQYDKPLYYTTATTYGNFKYVQAR